MWGAGPLGAELAQRSPISDEPISFSGTDLRNPQKDKAMTRQYSTIYNIDIAYSNCDSLGANAYF